jgi:hypothetical protein
MDHDAPEAALRFVAEDELDGYTEGADRLVRALRREGVGVEYRALYRYTDTPWSLRPHSRDLTPGARAPRSAPTMVRMVPPRLPQIVEAIGEGRIIWQTVWETEQLPPHWVPLLNNVELVVVPTEWNRDAFASSGVTTEIAVVPHVVCDVQPGDRGAPLDLPDDVVVFYTIGAWNERKQPGLDLRAFLDAFTADDPVALVIKTGPFATGTTDSEWASRSPVPGTTALEVARIIRAYPRPPLVRLEVGSWTRERIAGLHTRGDCFISLSHGEGWHVGAFDAAAYGNPVVMTGWGGQLEYLHAESSFLVEHDMEPIRYFHPLTDPADQHWAAPHVDHAVEQLRAVANDVDAARRRAEPQRVRVLHDYAAPRVTHLLGAAVPEVAAALRVDT